MDPVSGLRSGKNKSLYHPAYYFTRTKMCMHQIACLKAVKKMIEKTECYLGTGHLHDDNTGTVYQ